MTSRGLFEAMGSETRARLRQSIIVAGLLVVLLGSGCSALPGGTRAALSAPGARHLVCTGGYASRIETSRPDSAGRFCHRAALSDVLETNTLRRAGIARR